MIFVYDPHHVHLLIGDCRLVTGLLHRSPMSFMMRNVNGERADRVLYLWSPAPVSVPPGYHKIPEPVKARRITHDLGGPGPATEL
jgi:hypothetical protein